MNTEVTLYKEMKDWQDGARRDLVREMEQTMDKNKQLKERLRYLDTTGDLLSRIVDLNGMLTDRQAEIDNLNGMLTDRQAEIDDLQQQLQEERERRLTAGVAQQSSQDDIFRAMRSYLNYSKRKTLGKREAAKMVLTELFTRAKMDLPEDIMELLEHLDDEQAEPKVVTVNGSYNDVHHFHGDIDKLTISSE